MFSNFRKAGKDTPKSDKADKAHLANCSFELLTASPGVVSYTKCTSHHIYTLRNDYRFSNNGGTVALGGHGPCLIKCA